jgi:hypothetical protein
MSRRDERVDEGLIHAWLDGELDAVEAARVERLVAEDAEWAAAAAEARGLIAASSRILGALDMVAGDVIPRGGSAAGTAAPEFGESRVAKPSVARRGLVPTWMRIAAGFVLVAGVAYLGRGRGDMGTSPTVIGEVAADAVAPARIAAAPIAPPAAEAVVAPSAEQESKLSVTAKQNEAAPSRREAQSPVAAMLPPQERTAPAAAPAAAPAPAFAPTAPTSAATTRGVAGGVASPAVMRAAAEPQAAGGAVAGVTAGAAAVTADRELRAKSMQRAVTAARSAEAERMVDSPSALSALVADRAENAAALATVTGCWRAHTAARVDSIQTSMRVVRIAGDTLVLALTPAGAEARVLRESADALTGTARDASGRSAAFRAERTACMP